MCTTTLPPAAEPPPPTTKMSMAVTALNFTLLLVALYTVTVDGRPESRTHVLSEKALHCVICLWLDAHGEAEQLLQEVRPIAFEKDPAEHVLH